MSIRFTTLRAEPDRREALLQLWIDNFPNLQGEGLAKRYDWAYAQNPAGPAETVLALHGENDVVGCGSIYPRRIHVAGAELLAGMPADFAVARAHRSAGAALGIQRALIAGAGMPFAFYFGFPNKAALPILQRIGYRVFAAACDFVKPLSADYKVREYIAPAWAARVAAAPVDWYLRAADAGRRRKLGKVKTEIVDRADRRFDELWDRARRDYVVAGERSAAYLNWRSRALPATPYRFFTMSSGPDLVGYIAFTGRDNKAFVADLFAADMETAAEQLLLEFCRAMRDAGCQSVFISYAGNSQFALRLKRLGFIPRPSVERNMVAFTSSVTEPQAKVLLDAENWHLFGGEMDI